MIKKVFFAVFGMIVLILSLGFVFAVDDLMALQGNVKSGTSNVNGNLVVSIYDAYSGGNLIYNSTTDFNSAVVDGKYDVMLGNGTNELSLQYGKFYYLELYVNSEQFTFNGFDRQVFQSSTGWINTTDNMNVYGNFTVNNSVLFVNRDFGMVGIGTATPTQTLNVVGDLNVTGIIFGAGNTNLLNFNKTYADTLYSTIGFATNSSYMTSITNSSYMTSITNASYQYWTNSSINQWLYNQTTGTYNLTYANFNKTYADTLYSTKGIWNWTFTSTLFAPNNTINAFLFNKTYGDTLYSGIQWGYNMTVNFGQTNSSYLLKTLFTTGWDSNWTAKGYDKWMYNMTVNFGQTNSSYQLTTWNKTYADTLYSNIIWGYNMSINYGQTNSSYAYWTNGSLTSTYNATYAIWSYNQSDGATNSSYSIWSYNQTKVQSYTNIALTNISNSFTASQGIYGVGLSFNVSNVTDTQFFVNGANGRVGIGTTSPRAKLDVVAGDIVIDKDQWIQANTTWGLRKLIGETDNGGTQALTIIRSSDNYAAGGSGIDFQSFAGLSLVRIVDNGNVGIGNSTPSSSLVVGSTFFVNNTNGRVGIGTASPGALLHTYKGASGFAGSYNARTVGVFENSASTGSTISIMGPATGYSGIYFGDDNLETAGQIKYYHATDSMGFTTAGSTDKITILSTGNVGIGTTSPTSKLQVEGNITSNGTRMGTNDKAYFGNADDSSQYYNGTCMIISGPTSTFSIC